MCGHRASTLNTFCSADANRLIWNTMWWTINSPKSIVSCGNLCPALKGRGVSKANIVGKVRINLRFPASACFHHETGTKSSFKDNWVLNYQSFRRFFFFFFQSLVVRSEHVHMTNSQPFGVKSMTNISSRLVFCGAAPADATCQSYFLTSLSLSRALS